MSTDPVYGPPTFTSWLVTADRYELELLLCYVSGYAPEAVEGGLAHLYGATHTTIGRSPM